MPNARLTYTLSGPVNGGSSWYGSDNNNFGPRFALAYSPSNSSGVLKKVFGSSGVFRAGAGMVYDRFGSQLITQFDQFGSFGLSTTLGNPISYDFTTSPRYTGSAATPGPAPTRGLSYTPPDLPQH